MQRRRPLASPIRLQTSRKRSVGFVLEKLRLSLTYFQPLRYLRRGTIREVLQPYPYRKCPAAVMRPNQPAPTEIVSMADKSRLAPVVLIEFESVLDRPAEPLRWILFICLKIDIREVEIKRGREDEAIVVRDACEEARRVVNVEFVRIEPAPPVARRCYAPARFEYFPAELVGEGAIILTNDLNLRITACDGLYCLPCPIGTAIVKDEYPVAPAKRSLQCLIDNIVLVPNAANAEYLHAESDPLTENRERIGQKISTGCLLQNHPFIGGILGERAAGAAPNSSLRSARPAA